MNTQEAHKIVKQLLDIANQNKPDVWVKHSYEEKPDLKFITLEISIILASKPNFTRRMEKQ